MSGMTVIVKTMTRIVSGLIFLFGCYIVLHGHLTPGGGFAGGVIIAASFVLLILAFGGRESGERRSYTVASAMESGGGILFLGIALLGLVVGSWFFSNLLPHGTPLRIWSAGIILPANIAIGIKVGAGLVTIFLAFAATKHVMKE
jgi:multicomponent Na+:H+ antiporter subunit B